MRVLYFHQYFCTPEGSSGTRSYEMARRLLSSGHQVTMVCGGAAGNATGLSGPFVRGVRRGYVDGIDVVELDLPYSNYMSLPKRALLFLRYALRTIRLALSLQYDLVFATSTPLTAGIPGIFARALRRKPFVFEVRDLWPELPRAMGVVTNPIVLWSLSVLEWVTYHAAQACIGLSPGIVTGIERCGISRDRIFLVPNGCDLELFGAANTKERLADVPEGDLLAVFTGAHGMANGLDAVLDAASVLRQRGRVDIHLAFVGDGKLKPALKARAELEGLTNCMFADPMPKRKLAAVLKGCDIGMMVLSNVPAFYYGTSPNKFFDYIASGLPVLNNYPGWLADMIDEVKCGLVISPQDAESFADALEFASDHRDELLLMGKKARELAEARFGRENLGDRFVEALEAVAER